LLGAYRSRLAIIFDQPERRIQQRSAVRALRGVSLTQSSTTYITGTQRVVDGGFMALQLRM